MFGMYTAVLTPGVRRPNVVCSVDNVKSIGCLKLILILIRESEKKVKKEGI